MRLQRCCVALLLALAAVGTVGKEMCPAPQKIVKPTPKPPLIKASFYADMFDGLTMANGEPFDPDAMTVAHLRYRLGTRLRLTCPQTGRSVVVEVTDRGPYAPGSNGAEPSHKYKMDLSPAVFDALGVDRERGWMWLRVRELRGR